MPNPAWDRVEQLRAENDALAQRLAEAEAAVDANREDMAGDLAVAMGMDFDALTAERDAAEARAETAEQAYEVMVKIHQEAEYDRQRAEARATRAEEALRDALHAYGDEMWHKDLERYRAALLPTEEPEHG